MGSKFEKLWELALANQFDEVRTLLLNLTPEQRRRAQYAAGIITNEYRIIQEAADDHDSTA